MELWIRSQDKTTLSQIKQIAVEYDKKIVGYNGYCVKLGEYKSKGRALEVLNDIQKTITINETISGSYEEQDTTIKALFLKYQTRIYQMPEE